MIAPDTVEVGREYPVTCLLDHGNWLPVFPTPHTDNEREFFVDVPEHFHYDRRFINETHEAVKSLGQLMEVRPMICLRETHIPPQHIIWMHLALLNHFKDHRLKNPLVCPHKGMPIINGVCAGQGLKWNADGYLKHRGPFKLRWGPNEGEITSLERVVIHVTAAHSAPLILDIIDGDGQLVFTHANKDGPRYNIAAVLGDEIRVNNNHVEMIRR
jgi:hypothetical protein